MAAFNWLEVKTRVTVDGVVTVVDTAAVAAGRFADDEAKVAAQRAQDASLDHDNPLEELFEDQITAADLIVLNKADLVDAETLDRVKREIGGHSAASVKIVACEGGRLPTDVLLGLGSATEDLIEGRKSHHELEHEGQGGAGAHEHDHDEFESFVVEAGDIADPKAFAGALTGLIERHDILRLKGFANVPGKPMRLVVQAVGQRIETLFRPGLEAGRAPRDEAGGNRLA